MRNKLTIAVLSLVVGLAAATAQSFAQAPSGDSFSKYLFIFERSAAQIKQELAGNARHIASIRQEIEQGVDSIVLVGYASPEGDEARNMTLAKGRSAAVRDFLSSQTGLPLDKISIHDVGEDWEGFAAAVNATYNRPDREDVMRILSSDKSNAAKKEAFKKLDGGRTWQDVQLETDGRGLLYGRVAAEAGFNAVRWINTSGRPVHFKITRFNVDLAE